MKASTPRLGSGAWPRQGALLTAELAAGQGRMASAPCLFIAPLQHKENTPARASRARTCAPFGQTDASLPRTCFLSSLGDRGRDAAAPQLHKGCFPSWRETKAESSGGAFQRVLHQGCPKPRCWSRKRAGSVSGRAPQLPPARPIPAGSSKPRAGNSSPTLLKSLCGAERCLGSGSEQAKSPVRHCIT